MSQSHLNRIAETDGIRLAIVSPDGRQGMVEHARDLSLAKIPYVLDPGQGLPMFSGEDLLEMMEGARCLTVNDYEARLFEQKTRKTPAELARQVEAVIVTRGSEGADIFTGTRQIRIPAITPESLVDPTGCGDAFRAGLLYGMVREWDWQKSAQLASVMGSIKIGHRGGQNHAPLRDEIADRFATAFGDRPW
jgi:adenosine kinase